MITHPLRAAVAACAGLGIAIALALAPHARAQSDPNVSVTVGPASATSIAHSGTLTPPIYVTCKYSCAITGVAEVSPDVAHKLGLSATHAALHLGDLDAKAEAGQRTRITYVSAVDPTKLADSLRFPLLSTLDMSLTVNASYTVTIDHPDQFTTSVVNASFSWPRIARDTHGVGKRLLAGVNGPPKASLHRGAHYRIALHNITDDFVQVSLVTPGGLYTLTRTVHVARGRSSRGGGLRASVDGHGNGTIDLALPRRGTKRAKPYLPLPAEIDLAAGKKRVSRSDHALYRFTLVR